MLRVTNPAHKRLSLSGFLFLRTIFTIQGAHKSLPILGQEVGAIGRSWLFGFGSGWTLTIWLLIINFIKRQSIWFRLSGLEVFQFPHHRQYFFVVRHAKKIKSSKHYFMGLIEHLEKENKLRNEAWQKVKEDWRPQMEEHYFTDETKKIIAGKIQGVNTIIGYFHFEYTQGNELLSYGLVSDINTFSKEITNIAATKKWFPVKMALITTYKLSSFGDINLNSIDISGKMFGYINTYPNYDKRNFKLQMDEVLLQRLQADMMKQQMRNK